MEGIIYIVIGIIIYFAILKSNANNNAVVTIMGLIGIPFFVMLGISGLLLMIIL